MLRFAISTDVELIISFIDEHWKRGHVFARDRELFEYMYLEQDGRLNFVIAIDPLSDKVIAILGYIPSDSLHSRISLSMWKSRSDPSLRKYRGGLSVLKFLVTELKPLSIFSSGILSETRDMFNFLGYSCDAMNHHVIVNNEISDFQIIQNPPKTSFLQPFSDHGESSLAVITTDEELRRVANGLDFAETLKDADYLCHRYLNHPRFNYEIREVISIANPVGILVFRRSFANDRSCIRIIDVVGAELCLRSAIVPLVQEMQQNGDEYIDLLSWGLDLDQIKEIGFTDCRELADCVVPEYFSPFSQTNVDRWLFTNLPESEIIFKGDGDQDRPN